MKNKMPLRLIIFLIILAIPVYIRVFTENSEISIWMKIFSAPFAVFACFLGSGTISLAGGVLMHFAFRFCYWIFDDKIPDSENEYEDVVQFMCALFPIAFAVAYYAMYTIAI